GLLAWVGCHVDAYEQAKWFGDDIALKRDHRLVDRPGIPQLVSAIGAGRPLFDRLRTGVAFITGGMRDAMVMIENHWLATEALAAATGWAAVLAAEPALETVMSEEQFDDALEAIADFTDLKSPYVMGHSRGVADLAADAGRGYGLPAGDVATLRRAGLVHDFG